MAYYPGFGRSDPRKAAAAVVVALALAAGAGKAHASGHHHHSHGSGGTFRTAAAAISYARHQLGKSYCWGGTGPSCYDCSGLMYMAYGLPWGERTAAEQWAGLPHVRHPRPGDLVFFPGVDGTWSRPGHVALVISGHRMIQAYAQGVPIEVSPLSGNGAGGIIGYARPS